MTQVKSDEGIHDKIMDLAKKRGIFWPSFEIYGGVAGFYDFGPIGVLIKRNLINHWLRYFVYTRENVTEIETPIINPRIVFKASGHEDHFTDPILVCTRCGRVYRADHLIKDVLGVNVEGWKLEDIDELVKSKGVKCPECGGELSKTFNALLLFTTDIGPYKGEKAYLKPEHAQGMFINFPLILKIMRERLPLGVAQVGKVARNEISPRQGLLRLREFTIMEVEFFFDPEDTASALEAIEAVKDEVLRVITATMRENGVEEPAEYTAEELVKKNLVKTPWLAYWMAIGNMFLKSIGIPHDKIRFCEKLAHERAHYSAQTFDQEVYTTRYGWVEVAGYAYRTSYDLERHAEYSKADFTYFKRFETPITYVVEKAYPNPHVVEKYVGKEMLPSILKELSQRAPEKLYKELSANNYVIVAGHKLPPECFVVKREEVKIHGKKIIPHVVEPSFGLERVLYVMLEYAYTERDGKNILRLPPHLAPYHVAVFPLVAGKKPEQAKIVEVARAIYRELVEKGFRVIYDEEGSIGRRYARVDEIGVPFAITVDYQTLEDGTVTIRDRDTTEQVRISIRDIHNYLINKLGVLTLTL